MYEPVVEKKHWDDAELIAEAQKQIILELRGTLEKDIAERLIASDLKRVLFEEKNKRVAGGNAYGKEGSFVQEETTCA